MRLLSGLVALLAMLGILLAPGTTLASDPPDWAEPVQLGAGLPSSWFPGIDADPTGKVRLVWNASLVEGDANAAEGLAGAVVISEFSEDGWSEPSDIFVMDGGIASRPIIASDGAWAHLIFRYAPPGVPVRAVYSRAPLSADLSNTHSWSEPRHLSVGESYWAQLQVLPDGSLVALFNQVTMTMIDGVGARRTALFARRSSDYGVTWSPPVRLSNGTEHVARVSLAVSPDGSILLAAWDVGYDNLAADGEPSGLATAFSTDAGRTWSEPRSLVGNYEQSVVETDGNRALLVYRSTSSDLLYFQSSGDGGRSWSEPGRIANGIARPYPGKHNFDKLSLAIDGDGRFLLSWIGANNAAPNGLSILAATWADDEWTSPEIVASPDGYPEYPRITVALGNQVQLAYFVRDEQFKVGQYTMWTVGGISNAQRIAPADIAPATIAPPTPPILQTPELFAWSTPAAVPTPGPETFIVNRTPQDLNTQPIRMIATVTTGGLLLVVVAAVVIRRLFRM